LKLTAINRGEAAILKEYYDYILARLFRSTLKECARLQIQESIAAMTIYKVRPLHGRFLICLEQIACNYAEQLA